MATEDPRSSDEDAAPPGSETNPETIEEHDWAKEDREFVTSIRDGLREPRPGDREAVLDGLRRLADEEADWLFPGQIARQLDAPQAQPALEQLVDEGLAEQAIRASGWRCVVYRLALAQRR